MKAYFLPLILIVVCSQSVFAQSGVPRKMNFQACLEDVTSEMVAVTFKIFPGESGGVLLWENTRNVQPVDCFFSIVLGELEAFPEDLFSENDALYLELTVNGSVQPERFPLNSTPYSMRAQIADHVKENVIDSSSIMDGAITNEDISMDAALAIGKISGDVGLNYNIIGSVNSVPITGQYEVLGSMELIAPGDGHVLLILGAQVRFFGDGTLLYLGLGKGEGVDVLNVSTAGNIDGTGTDRSRHSMSVMDVVPVSAGFNIFHVLTLRDPAISRHDLILDNVRLIGLFIPKRYNDQ